MRRPSSPTPAHLLATPGGAVRGVPGGGAPGGMGGGPGLGGGGGGPAGGFQWSIPPVLVVKPPDGVDFVEGGTLAGATSANTPAVVGACTFTIPVGMTGYLRSFVLGVNTLLPTSNIFFTVRFNQAAAPGWARILIAPGNIAVYREAWPDGEVYLEIPERTEVDISVTVLDGGTYPISATMHGWYVATELARASAQGWRI